VNEVVELVDQNKYVHSPQCSPLSGQRLRQSRAESQS
jgi:hypothetical protein